ncbi:MAG: hypothetical protein REI09_05345 [Candidatus Dactylopiibacterium sp.]|nr:hypothetical protein [Candidatus Dactylopiibacterium sp.]
MKRARTLPAELPPGSLMQQMTAALALAEDRLTRLAEDERDLELVKRIRMLMQRINEAQAQQMRDLARLNEAECYGQRIKHLQALAEPAPEVQP